MLGVDIKLRYETHLIVWGDNKLSADARGPKKSPFTVASQMLVIGLNAELDALVPALERTGRRQYLVAVDPEVSASGDLEVVSALHVCKRIQ